MHVKPTIGITKPDNEDLLAFFAIWTSVKLAGGRPLILTPSEDYKHANIDGLILGGGKDVFPGLYDQPAQEEYMYDHERDDMEVFWAARAREQGLPTLGICRGAQLMNVVAGGTLHKSVAEAYENARYPDGILHHTFYRKKIFIEEKCLLHKITQRRELKVNSIHKQAIAELGSDIYINATEQNGVIQAITCTNHPFYLGIQFHPEFLIYRKIFRRIFETLIGFAKGTNYAL